MLQNLKNPLIPVTGLGPYENHGHVGQVAEKNDNFFTNHKKWQQVDGTNSVIVCS